MDVTENNQLHQRSEVVYQSTLRMASERAEKQEQKELTQKHLRGQYRERPALIPTRTSKSPGKVGDAKELL
jgi:hypothetical protein